MPLEVKLTPKLTYRLRLSPQMKLSLSLLQLPILKLKEYVIEQIEKNPLLEPANDETMPEEKIDSGLPWSEEDEEKKEYRESLITTPPTLQEYLLNMIGTWIFF